MFRTGSLRYYLVPTRNRDYFRNSSKSKMVLEERRRPPLSMERNDGKQSAELDMKYSVSTHLF